MMMIMLMANLIIFSKTVGVRREEKSNMILSLTLLYDSTCSLKISYSEDDRKTEK